MKQKSEQEYTSFFHLWNQPLEKHRSLKKNSSFELKRQPSLLSLVNAIGKLQSISTHDDILQNVKHKGKEGSRLHISENGQDVLVMEIASKRLQVVAGTLEKLFIKLADESAQDFDYIDTYILCHLFFTDSLELLENLMARFHLEALPDDMYYFDRVLNVILRWIKLQFQDFKSNPVLMARLEAFLHGDVSRSGYKAEASMVKKALDEQKLVSYDTDLKLKKNTRLTFYNNLTDILYMNSKDAAKRLTLVDYYILKCITAQDYLAMFFSKTENKTDNIALMTERANKLSKWVLEQVTLHELHSKQRRATLRKIMEIAKLCLSWNNFHTCMVITMGLTQLEEFNIVTFKNLFKYLNVCNNMSYYRHAFRKAAKSPCIPFFPIVLKDLTFFIEGNATKKPDGLINFLKFRVLSQLIHDILSYTMEDYHFVSSLDQVFESLLNKKVHSTSLCD
ncbi:ras guanine nucleotide exchange factor domain-containing protein [Gilbertella persicaria]|uniref:ras guanine nucleotide exchange factor domain-containing protein n=1 Tax=Gilbertella persicaria TaxID=101096 RepID=UPI00221E38F3|nr:ras guanine nucleotide exchange factor domain-containing protein [Gilbertella persicaria]KAI8085828.1 ras guanine nucleotide exchange factor domain-containing protein [Gilbertella persicaria]